MPASPDVLHKSNSTIDTGGPVRSSSSPVFLLPARTGIKKKTGTNFIVLLGEALLFFTFIFLLTLRFVGRSVVFPFRLPRLIRAPRSLKSLIGRYFSLRTRHGFALGVCASFLLLGTTGSLLLYDDLIYSISNPFISNLEQSASTRIMDRKGQLLYTIYGKENRTIVSLNSLPKHLVDATIAIEDVDFYHHHGVSLRGIARAAKANFIDHSPIQGGSTITQQLAKNILLTPERTYTRKIKEVLLALLIESRYTKDQILEMYLNEVAYGGPVSGVEAASQYYFGKSASLLSVSEAALLAGLPSQPSATSPFVNAKVAQTRQRVVLDRMVAKGFLDSAEASQAKQEKLVYAPQSTAILAPHAVMMVKEALVDRFGPKLVEEGGLQVTTTIDLAVQNMAENVVKEQIEAIEESHNVHNGAAVVMNPQTGEVLAVVGSKDYFDPSIKGNVNVATSLRQPGSSIKPLTYAYAFEHMKMHPGTTVDDSPIVYQIPGSKPYAPANYDGTFKGKMTIRQALAQSRNIPPVKLLKEIGVENLINEGQKMGITTWNDSNRYGLSLTLGAGEVKLLDLATAYGSLATMGVRHDPVLIQKITTADGKVVVDREDKETAWSGILPSAHAAEPSAITKGSRVLSQTSAYYITSILSDNQARLPAFGNFSKLFVPGKTIAVKTGTTNDFRDNWTMGYTPDYVVGVWVGNTDNTPMNSNLASGITGAAPIWHDIMEHLIKDVPNREWARPNEMVPVQICAIGGQLTCQYCPQTVTEYFAPDKVPTQACKFEQADVCIQKKIQTERDGKTPEEAKVILQNCYFGPEK